MKAGSARIQDGAGAYQVGMNERSNVTQVRRSIATVFLIAACSLYLSPAQTESAETTFKPYTTCALPNGPSVIETSPLAPGVTTRTVQTLKGNLPIRMLEGRRVMFAYPGEDFYANVKVEVLPGDSWDNERIALTDNFDYLLASGDDLRNYSLKPQLNGFSIEGQDRQKREGGVLGFYLLFENATHTVITIYFLNQEPPLRFKTMEEYAKLRDKFLNDYTACIRKGLRTQ
jgi:hypothetical protein